MKVICRGTMAAPFVASDLHCGVPGAACHRQLPPPPPPLCDTSHIIVIQKYWWGRDGTSFYCPTSTHSRVHSLRYDGKDTNEESNVEKSITEEEMIMNYC